MSVPLHIDFTDKAPSRSGAIVLYSDDTGKLGASAAPIWKKSGLDYARLAAATGFAGRPGHMIDLVAPDRIDADRLVLLGRGSQDEEETEGAWANRGGSLVAKLEALQTEEAAIVLDDPDLTPAKAAAIAAGARLRAYKFEKYHTQRPSRAGRVKRLTFHLPSVQGMKAAFAGALAVADGTLLARDLVNEPANLLGPIELAEAALELRSLGLDVEVLGESELADLKMGALLAVGQGSVRPPRLVVLRWNGGKKSASPLAFIGKGIAFDTGGISIKPAASMENMKGDMGGAAAVMGLMRALAQRKAKVNAIGVLALAENMPDANAFRPGDVITAMSGKTIEIISTDAEGRLVLADALWYTQERFKPAVMVDLATLTGAMLVALGHEHAGLFTNTDHLAAELYDAGQVTGEKVWHMPMGRAYDKLIESRFADIKNQGGRNGGSILAAQFLAHFVKDTPWVHLDIAGMAFGGPASETNTSWSTGFGVALLDRWIRDRHEN